MCQTALSTSYGTEARQSDLLSLIQSCVSIGNRPIMRKARWASTGAGIDNWQMEATPEGKKSPRSGQRVRFADEEEETIKVGVMAQSMEDSYVQDGELFSSDGEDDWSEEQPEDQPDELPEEQLDKPPDEEVLQNDDEESPKMFRDDSSLHFLNIPSSAYQACPALLSCPMVHALQGDVPVPLKVSHRSVTAMCVFNKAVISVDMDLVGPSAPSPLHLTFPRERLTTVHSVEVFNDTTDKTFTTMVVAKPTEGSMTGGPCLPGLFLGAPILFTTPCGMGFPGQKLRVIIRYSQPLSFLEGSVSLRVPLALPSVEASGNPELWGVQIHLEPVLGQNVDYQVHSHAHYVQQSSAERVQLALETADNMDVNRDLQVSYKLGGELPEAVMLTHGSKRQTSPCCLCVSPSCAGRLPIHPRSVLILLDCSSNMKGAPLVAAQQALQVTLDSLISTDYLAIGGYGFTQAWWLDVFKSGKPKHVKSCKTWLKSLSVMPGTSNLLSSLTKGVRLLRTHMSKDGMGTLPLIYIITEGSTELDLFTVTQVQELLDEFPDDIAAPRIHTMGIGPLCNHMLLRYLSSMTGGHSETAFHVGEVLPVMEQWLVATRYPVMTGLQVVMPDNSPEELELSLPSVLPDLYVDLPLSVPGRYKGTLASGMRLLGYLGDGTESVMELPLVDVEEIGLDLVFAAELAEDMDNQLWRAQDSEAEHLEALQHGLALEVPNMSCTTMIGVLAPLETVETLRHRCGAVVNASSQMSRIIASAKAHDGKVVELQGGAAWSTGEVDAAKRMASLRPEKGVHSPAIAPSTSSKGFFKQLLGK